MFKTFKTHYQDLICINKTKIKEGYEAKLQDRLWSFNFAVKNAPLLEAIFTYLKKTIELSDKNPQKGEEKINQDCQEMVKAIEEISQEVKEESPEELTYSNLLLKEERVSRVNKEKILGTEFKEAYLPKRGAILKKIMRILQ